MLGDGTFRYDLPIVDIELIYKEKTIKIQGLVDSGCQTTNIKASIARDLGIEFDKPNWSIGGMGGNGQPGWKIDGCRMKLKDHGNDFNASVIFTENMPFPAILGQDNFFENFNIKFEKKNRCFELKRVS
jgi:hypothetical protein